MYPEYNFKSSFFSSQAGRLHYIDEGEGPVVILVHGNPTWSYYYRHVIRLLRKTHRVIALDHIGCGLSDKPQKYDYTLQNHIQNLTDLINFLEIETFSLVVHDWGGAIGLGAGGLAPEKVEKVVILNTAAFRSTRIPFRISICRVPLLGVLIVRGGNGFAWPATFMAVSKKLSKPVKDAYIAPYNSWQNRIATHRFVLDIPLTQDHRSYDTLVTVEKNLHFLHDKKVLVLWGGKDFCFNDHFYREWQQRCPHGEFHYFKDAGHYVLEDEKDNANTLLSSFFGNL